MSRAYGQLCGVAAALDLVGERWTLLVVRELMAGPARYRDLVEGIPGVATDVLAERLRSLEAYGLVSRAPDLQDGRSHRYALTEPGRELEPVLLALARVGVGHLDRVPPGAAFRPPWLELAVRAVVGNDGPSEDLVVAFRLDGQSLRLRLSPTGVSRDDDAQADLMVEGEAQAFLESLRSAGTFDRHLADGRLRLDGSRAARTALREALHPGI